MQISKDEGVSYPRMFWGNFFYLQGFRMMMLTSKIMSKVNIFIFLIQESVFFFLFLLAPCQQFFFSFFLTSLLLISFSLLMNLKLKGVGMDASVTPLRHGGLSLVQTTDFFYPLVDDPYMQGSFY